VTQPFEASEARIQSFLDSIRSGQPIDNGRHWSVLDLLTLAGCARAPVCSHPPVWIAEDDLDALDSEKREAIETTHQEEVSATIRFLSCVATETMDGRFGEHAGVRDIIRGVLAIDAAGELHVQLSRAVS
jgi:hypothetical protein